MEDRTVTDTPATPLVKKLGIKPGHHVLVLNAPSGFVAALGTLPATASLTTQADSTFDAILVFVHNKAEADKYTPLALRALKARGLLWFAYPKKSAKVETDIS